MLPKTLAVTSLWPVLSLLIYLVLTVCLVVVLKEPYNLYKKNDTAQIADTYFTKKLGMRQHPTLVLCDVQPLAKKAAGMDSLEDVNNYTNVFTNYVGTEDNWKASDFIETFLLARSLVDGKFVPLDTSDFKPLVVSFFRFGICFAKDLGPEIESDEGMVDGMSSDKIFSTTFLLSFKPDPPETESQSKSQYAAFVVDLHEELLLSGPVVMMDEAGVAFTTVEPGRGSIVRIQQEYHENIKYCAQNNRKMSDCVAEYMEERFGACDQVPLVEGFSAEEGGCSIEQLLQRGFFLETLKTEGLEAIDARTSCLLPCDRMSFKPFRLVEDVGEIVFPDLALVVRDLRARAANGSDVDNTLTAIALVLPRLPKIKRVRELFNYPVESFGGEVGGYIGMFLGLSIWGIYCIAKDVAVMLHGRFAGGGRGRRLTPQKL